MSTSGELLSASERRKREQLGPFHDYREAVLAGFLAALAGATGAAAWMYSSGWYVTFMTGNSERMVLEHTKGHHQVAFTALATVLAFVFGAFVATIARQYVWKRASHGATVLHAISNVVAWGVDTALTPADQDYGAVPILCLAFGLGALNTSISRRGEVAMPLSYVTGTLVKIGQGVALHICGVKRWAWMAHATTYTGFLMGVAIGGGLFAIFDEENTLMILSLGSIAAAVVTWRLDHSKFSKLNAV